LKPELWSISDIKEKIRPKPFRAGDEFWCIGKVTGNEIHFHITRVGKNYFRWRITHVYEKGVKKLKNYFGHTEIDRFNKAVKSGRYFKK
jgi:hypothetical protein